MSVTIHIPTDEIDALINGMADDVEAAVRPAAQAGAQVLYDEVKRNVAGLGRVSGNLDRAIYQAYSKDNSGPGRATYHVSWNAKKAPHGHLVEYGYIQRYRVFKDKDGKFYTDKRHPLTQPRHVAANPFVRPAQAKFNAAQQAAVDELLMRIDGDKK